MSKANKITKAIIPAAGLGTRFLPMSKSSPKEMLPIVDKPVIQFVIEEAVASGIEDILIVTGRGKRAIENHFDSAPGLQQHLEKQGKVEQAETVRQIGDHANIFFVRQKEQLGLGDAVRLGRSFVGREPFALMLGDTIIEPDEKTGLHGLQELMAVYEEFAANVVAVREVPKELLSRYGIVDGEPISAQAGALYSLNKLIEKPEPENAPTQLAIAGRYLFNAEIFDYIDRTGVGKGNEIQLTDAMNLMAAERSVQALHWKAKRYDIGNKADYVRCFMDFAAKHPETRNEMAKFLAER
ncbi:MAG: UTP--glucose-1-phosphate uridylyltransferase GalU [Pseudomonadales bacterium]